MLPILLQLTSLTILLNTAQNKASPKMYLVETKDSSGLGDNTANVSKDQTFYGGLEERVDGNGDNVPIFCCPITVKDIPNSFSQEMIARLENQHQARHQQQFGHHFGLPNQVSHLPQGYGIPYGQPHMHSPGAPGGRPL